VSAAKAKRGKPRGGSAAKRVRKHTPAPVARAAQPAAASARTTYPQIVEDIWRAVAPLIGAITLAALAQSAIRRAAAQHPLLERVGVTIDGFDRIALEDALAGASPTAQADAMAELGKQLLGVFESVAGALIIKQIWPMTQQLEQLVGAQRSGA